LTRIEPFDPTDWDEDWDEDFEEEEYEDIAELEATDYSTLYEDEGDGRSGESTGVCD
jgi:hypothetical protein